VTTPSYALLIPVKDSRSVKTRLGVGDDGQRARLMTAFAQDSISAAAAVTALEVYVVGDVETLGDLVHDLGITVLPDEGEGDLNQALVRAAARLEERGLGVAVMLADLPCLRTADLAAAFEQADGRSFVADAAGTGTTLLIAPSGTELDPRFGTGSAARHRDSGATQVGTGLDSLTLDVDTTADLETALNYGVGVHTAQVAASLL
jgi:2-phospho-L-lactate guanylyltransferase